MAKAPSDYLSEPVPAEGRNAWPAAFFVFVGFIIVVGIMAVGGGLAAQQTKSDFYISVLLGNFVLAVLGGISGWIGADSGRTFNQLMEQAFPGFSWRIVSLYVPIVLLGWFGVEASLFAKLVGYALGWSASEQRWLMGLSALGFSVSSYIGFKAMKWVSYIGVPVMLVIGAFAIWRAALASDKSYGFLHSSISLQAGTALVMGSWIMGVLTCLPDLTRFCRSRRQGALVGFIGIFIANSFTLMMGGAAAALGGESDPAKILVSFGFIPLAIILSLANIWTTNDSNMYSAALNLARAVNVERKRTVLWCSLAAALFAATDPATISFLFGFLGFLGNTAPALGGVVLGAYLVNRSRIKPLVNPWAAWMGWVLASGLAIWLGGVIGIFLGLFGGFGIWLAVCLLTRNVVAKRT
jgi:cytosine permease